MMSNGNDVDGVNATASPVGAPGERPKSRNMPFSAILDVIPLGIVVLDRRARILFANKTASDLLRLGSELVEEGGYLRATSSRDARALAHALKSLCLSARDLAAFSIMQAERRPVSVVLARLPADQPVVAPDDATVAVFFSDPNFHDVVRASLLRDVFEFTRAESSVAVELMRSMDSGRVADDLGLSRHTVRNHFKSMFLKVGVRGQKDLLETFLRSPVCLRFESHNLSVDKTRGVVDS